MDTSDTLSISSNQASHPSSSTVAIVLIILITPSSTSEISTNSGTIWSKSALVLLLVCAEGVQTHACAAIRYSTGHLSNPANESVRTVSRRRITKNARLGRKQYAVLQGVNTQPGLEEHMRDTLWLSPSRHRHVLRLKFA